MKQMTILKIVSFLLFSTTAFGQPNLILSTGSISTTTIKRGDHLKITFRVGNVGNSIASISHTKIYVSNALSLTNAILLSEISTEALLAGQQTQDINFIYPLPYNTSTGNNYILAVVDSRNEVVESNENNGFSFASTINVSTNFGGQQNLPYPIILMHGLNGNDTTWYPFLRDVQNYFGFSYGGNFDFCLNQDGDVSNSNLIPDVRDWTDTIQIGKGDLYTVNFNIDNFGNKYISSSKSNQSAIVKQGFAISNIIKQVLTKTGREKVVLAGHSMGGLTCREYLQNNNRWQVDGKHHVAKLFTNGTPNGGSNSTAFGLGSILGTGVDEKSEAVRDLRRTYAISGDSGVYLFGGIETYSSINNNILFNYHNVDVNCNGVEGNSIIGLNKKTIPLDISYSCVIGNDPSTLLCSNCDGVVNIESANLNNQRPTANADTFMCVRSGSSATSPLHIELPRQTDFMLKGLDESNEYNTAYNIDTGRTYFANFSAQSQTGYIYDYDDYKVLISQNGLLNCKLYNIPTAKCYFNLLDSTQAIIYKDSTNGQGYYEFNKILNKGRYFVEFYTTPETTSWYYPYAFKVSLTPTLPLTLLDFVVTLQENKTILKWTTTNEINTNKFDIERSLNTKEWNTLGSVNSANLTGTNNYNLVDANPNYGINYYRLKMIDKDGSYTYSQIRSVEVNKPNTPFVIAPNPAKSKTTIYFNTPISKAEISVYDAQGRQVHKNYYSGNSLDKIELNTSSFLNGIYLISVKTSTNNYYGKILVSK
jgi:pimeloyl-ACP methyl ester carboxylesterase